MALFDKEHYGKPISEKLSDYLKKYTNSNDRANAATISGVGTSTIRDVMYRNNSLTEENSKGIIELMRIAIKNAKNALNTFSEHIKP